MHEKNLDAWHSPHYIVQELHPTLDFLKWDYGALDEVQERKYVEAKLQLLQQNMSQVEVSYLSDLIVKSHTQLRTYAAEHIQTLLPENEKSSALKLARCCVSQRDIQRVFLFYEKWKQIYKNNELSYPEDIDHHAVFVAIGLVYYMRLNHEYRVKYEEFLKNYNIFSQKPTFLTVWKCSLDWMIKDADIPAGIAKTDALKENFFAIVMCCITQTPLIITGIPGSSKTLSFNLVVSNCKGLSSKRKSFQNLEIFPMIEAQYYQCSRRTTATEIEKVVNIVTKRQRSYCESNLPVRCVLFMDEAGLLEKHQALKVLHPHLDKQEVSYVVITNSILDAAKTNRAVSLYRPQNSVEEIQSLADGCLRRQDITSPHCKKQVVHLSSAYWEVMCHPILKTFFGLRDFIHFVSFLRSRMLQSGIISPPYVLQALERNFNGSKDFNFVRKVFLNEVSAHPHICS